MSRPTVLAALAVVTMLGTARADRYEASVSLRGSGALARVGDDSTTGTVSTNVPGGGGTLGLAWGVRNFLDLGVELGATALGEASYDAASRPIDQVPNVGVLTRTTRTAQARLGATLRLGVVFVPTLYVGLGAGVRLRSTANLLYAASPTQSVELVPDDGQSSTTIDLVGTIRVGLDYRATRRCTIGLDVGGTQYIGIGVPDLQAAEVGLHVAYTWYPLW